MYLARTALIGDTFQIELELEFVTTQMKGKLSSVHTTNESWLTRNDT